MKRLRVGEDEWLEGSEAEELYKRLNGVEYAMVADAVLELWPRYKMVRPPNALTDPNNQSPDKNAPDLIVEWFYPGFTLTLARGYLDHPYLYGRMSAYAVQKIRSNNYGTKQRFRVGKSKKRKKASRQSTGTSDD